MNRTNKTVLKEIGLVKFIIDEIAHEYYIDLEPNGMGITVKLDVYKFEEIKKEYNLTEKVIPINDIDKLTQEYKDELYDIWKENRNDL